MRTNIFYLWVYGHVYVCLCVKDHCGLPAAILAPVQWMTCLRGISQAMTGQIFWPPYVHEPPLPTHTHKEIRALTIPVWKFLEDLAHKFLNAHAEGRIKRHKEPLGILPHAWRSIKILCRGPSFTHHGWDWALITQASVWGCLSLCKHSEVALISPHPSLKAPYIS